MEQTKQEESSFVDIRNSVQFELNLNGTSEQTYFLGIFVYLHFIEGEFYSVTPDGMMIVD